MSDYIAAMAISSIVIIAAFYTVNYFVNPAELGARLERMGVEDIRSVRSGYVKVGGRLSVLEGGVYSHLDDRECAVSLLSLERRQVDAETGESWIAEYEDARVKLVAITDDTGSINLDTKKFRIIPSEKTEYLSGDNLSVSLRERVSRVFDIDGQYFLLNTLRVRQECLKAGEKVYAVGYVEGLGSQKTLFAGEKDMMLSRSDSIT